MTARPDSAPFSFAVVILAAGRSRRMGRPKLLLPWGKTSILGHLIDQWQKLEVRQIAVVCASDDEGIAAELNRAHFPAADRIFNSEPDRGMFNSIQCAARWTGWQGELTHWALALGDQPHLRLETLRTVLDLSASEPIKVCQAMHAGHRRHPVLLPKAIFGQIANSQAPTLKEFLSAHDFASCELADAGLALDIDRPEDYEKALAQYSAAKTE